ncbi:MAG: hypothetical protein JWN84_2305 [Nocardioides sp.]|jgi:hypothetical protein|nr:hypothetical protein [Nocardioides sp.]
MVMESSPPAPMALTVAELLHEPSVAEAVSRAPRTWRSCVVFDHADDADPYGFYDECVDLMQFVWLSSDVDQWGETTYEIGLGDELGAYIDLRAEPDPVAEYLRAHPAVEAGTVEHDNDERYLFAARAELDTAAFSVIAVEALTTGHLAARRTAGLG